MTISAKKNSDQDAVGARRGEQGQPQKHLTGGKYLQELYYAGEVLSTAQRLENTGRSSSALQMMNHSGCKK